jgi:hypothetical protein
VAAVLMIVGKIISKVPLQRAPIYRVRARNTATDSENTIHADDTARQFGFRGGLVPGVTVFGYMVGALVERHGLAWFENGVIELKLAQPVYDGQDILIRTEGNSPVRISAERVDGEVCATAEARIRDNSMLNLTSYPEQPLPHENERPEACCEALTPGAVLGTLERQLDASQSRVFEALDETNPIYYGSNAIVHPAVMLELANQILMRNFRLGPWLHASSTVTNWCTARNGDRVQVRGRIADRFERKGHEFVVLDLVILRDGTRLLQQVTHTAIYRPKFART